MLETFSKTILLCIWLDQLKVINYLSVPVLQPGSTCTNSIQAGTPPTLPAAAAYNTTSQLSHYAIHIYISHKGGGRGEVVPTSFFFLQAYLPLPSPSLSDCSVVYILQPQHHYQENSA